MNYSMAITLNNNNRMYNESYVFNNYQYITGKPPKGSRNIFWHTVTVRSTQFKQHTIKKCKMFTKKKNIDS